VGAIAVSDPSAYHDFAAVEVFDLDPIGAAATRLVFLGGSSSSAATTPARSTLRCLTPGELSAARYRALELPARPVLPAAELVESARPRARACFVVADCRAAGGAATT
jgi:hypothetical protein